MVLKLRDKWVWDFWFARDGDDFHIFYLQADRRLEDETKRHWHVSIGHARSGDLRDWTILPDALGPSPADEDALPEPADNSSTWTGSIVRHDDGCWHLFYTGTRRSEGGRRQRICLATSNDLITWTRHGDDAILEADPRWYEKLDDAAWHDEAWRDPWVFRDPQDGRFHMYLTARANAGPADERGVIGHAVSDDLKSWRALPPVTEPGRYGQMEVPQLVEIGGRYYLIFCNVSEFIASKHAKSMPRGPVSGIHYLIADNPYGPFREPHDDFWIGHPVGRLYAGRLVEYPEGAWNLMAFRYFDEQGKFVGEITDPMPVSVAADGTLILQGKAEKGKSVGVG
ncbi:MAG: glycosyl hydrolase family 32 [Alphaproteobacteria bacterium]|nr:MAG: glycosyl hydrolase family 32 [Alphaproteobacteria bacterium]